MSSSTTTKKVTARTKARQKIAAQREEQARRQRADEADLAEILKALDSQEDAADKRGDALGQAKVHYDAAVEKAHADYAAAVADSETLLGQRLAAMRERGQSVGDLADLTELSETDVRRHIKAHKDRDESEQTATTGTANVAAQSQDAARSSEPTSAPARQSGQPSEALGGEGDQAPENSGADLSVAAS
ncbi:hypothetical protein ACLTEW_24480 [Gordonia lacunae]|uniref:hypothetical protein n=1 Tax=Gordonia TaxID=2053 RepID=UPI00200B1768|nr:hypothetical protein [Gordonia terrae]UPW12024.1 hypothetical protein M1C59_25590 [Gordonia terrae]